MSALELIARFSATCFCARDFDFVCHGERSKAGPAGGIRQGLPAIRRFNGASGYTAISFAGFVFKLRHSGWSEGIDSWGCCGSALSVS